MLNMPNGNSQNLGHSQQMASLLGAQNSQESVQVVHSQPGVFNQLQNLPKENPMPTYSDYENGNQISARKLFGNIPETPDKAEHRYPMLVHLPNSVVECTAVFHKPFRGVLKQNQMPGFCQSYASLPKTIHLHF